MFTRQFWSERRIAGALLVLSVLVLLPGVALYINRANRLFSGGDNARFQLERYFVLTSVIVSTLGLVMLETVLREAGDRVFARLYQLHWRIACKPERTNCAIIELRYGEPPPVNLHAIVRWNWY